MIFNKLLNKTTETWADMIARQEAERIKMLEEAADKARKYRITRRQSAYNMGMSYSTLSKLISEHDIDWPVFGKATGPKSISLDEYRRCADLGMNQTQAAEVLGVTPPAVSSISRKHNIKFNRKGIEQ